MVNVLSHFMVAYSRFIKSQSHIYYNCLPDISVGCITKILQVTLRRNALECLIETAWHTVYIFVTSICFQLTILKHV